jgi:hypothetical protein
VADTSAIKAQIKTGQVGGGRVASRDRQAGAKQRWRLAGGRRAIFVSTLVVGDGVYARNTTPSSGSIDSGPVLMCERFACFVCCS